MPKVVLDPFRFVVIALAGWMNPKSAARHRILREENRALREQLGGRRVRFNDDQRRRPAFKAKGLAEFGVVDLGGARFFQRSEGWVSVPP
jgi:hypothetical protein